MKKMLALLTVLSLLCCACALAQAAETGDGIPLEWTLPAVGDELEGFAVTELSMIDSLGAQVVLLTHVRTGARVIFVLNDDPNLGFSTCFHTEPSDDSGMLHILEHASCAASEKYPGRDVFFDAISQAYLTELNAWTSLSSTNYFATSMSEDQLEVMADFYLDCAFNSAILTEPNYFYREGWRYELPSLDSELTINGIVYNEMQGVYGNIYSAALQNLHKELYPDTYQAKDSGGDPAAIPTLSYDELIAFYKACYHPANSVTMYYGNLSMERFLKLMNDGYFAGAELQPSAPISAGQPAFAAPVSAEYAFATAADSTDLGSVILFAATLTDEISSDYRNRALCDELTTLLADDSSALMRALNDSGIASQYGIGYQSVGTQLELDFLAYDADASRAEEFKSIILDGTAAMIDAGFDADMMRAVFASTDMNLRLQRNSGNVATTLFNQITQIQETGSYDSLNSAAFYEEARKLCLTESGSTGYAEARLREWLIDNPHAALVTTIPQPGLLEENARKLADELAEYKASLSEEELQQLVDFTAKFNGWVELDTPQATLDKLDVVDPASVEANIPKTEILSETIDGVSIMSAPASMDMIKISLRLDLEHLTYSEMRRMAMLANLMGGSTQTHDQTEISILSMERINGLSAAVRTEEFEGGYRPVFEVAFYAPSESVNESVELVFEMLTQTDIADNLDLLAMDADSVIANFTNPESLYSILSLATLASSSKPDGLSWQLGGYPLRDECSALAEEYEQNPDALANALEELRTKALTRTNAQIMLVGDNDSTAKAALLKHVSALPEAAEGIERNDLTDARNVLFTGGTQASYFVRAIRQSELDTDLSGAQLVTAQLLSGEYMLPKLRFQLGAYSVGINVSSSGRVTVYYYRGSDPFEANDIVNAMPDYLKNMEIAQEQLDSYKLPIISNYVVPQGELNDAMNEMEYSMYGFDREKRLALIEEVRNVTVDGVKALAEPLRELLDKAGLAMVTTLDEADGHTDAFDATIGF